jgi:DOPA 4,5-dioxygenase
MINASGLRALIHPLTDDVSPTTQHTDTVGEPLDLDVSVLDPPGINRGVARLGR